MSNKYKQYTNKELDFIAKLKKQDKTNQYIADATGRTLDGIKSVTGALGLTKPRKLLTSFEKAIVLSGDSPINVGKIINRTNTQVSLIRYRLKRLKNESES